ncbi:hypothetical protein HOT31_gp037 [Microbacterium phage Hendrix]|uniref:Uncharacterized protein n=1 Tax=Microbacterium phage Hendrix TaxID=2182341 RepID=A0A2U8UU75_9CAUD|nr:hypothetical protein HOT31_gp037 [Microbacterium phage Hendrix]AWN07708.1 hypothetical protein PBI_HENDRIX_37 [Microbacterium phage Hendrix]
MSIRNGSLVTPDSRGRVNLGQLVSSDQVFRIDPHDDGSFTLTLISEAGKAVNT